MYIDTIRHTLRTQQYSISKQTRIIPVKLWKRWPSAFFQKHRFFGVYHVYIYIYIHTCIHTHQCDCLYVSVYVQTVCTCKGTYLHINISSYTTIISHIHQQYIWLVKKSMIPDSPDCLFSTDQILLTVACESKLNGSAKLEIPGTYDSI